MFDDIHIVLASASPRRSEILTKMGITFEKLPSEAEAVFKDKVDEPLKPHEKAEQLSYVKAADIAGKLLMGEARVGKISKGVLIIGADTVVSAYGEILEKPEGFDEACVMLDKLQGRWHEVYTGVTLVYMPPEAASGAQGLAGHEKAKQKTFSVCSNVEIYPMSGEEIVDYVAKEKPYDKAGGYAIQGSLCNFVKAIDGDYENIVGLPASRLYHEIKEIISEA